MNPPNSEQNPAPVQAVESAQPDQTPPVVPTQIATNTTPEALPPDLQPFGGMAPKPAEAAAQAGATPEAASSGTPQTTATAEGQIAANGQNLQSDTLAMNTNGAEMIQQSQQSSGQTSETTTQPAPGTETQGVAEHNPFFQESGTPAVLPSSDYQQAPQAAPVQPVEASAQQTQNAEAAAPPTTTPETPLQTPALDGAAEAQQAPATEAAPGQVPEAAPVIEAAQTAETVNQSEATAVSHQPTDSVVTEFNEDGTIKSPFSYAAETGDPQQSAEAVAGGSSDEPAAQDATTETPSNIIQFPSNQESSDEKTNESDEPREVANVIEFKNKAVEKIKGEIASNNAQITKLQEHNTALEAEINEIEKGAQELSEDPVGALISLANRKQSEPLDKAA